MADFGSEIFGKLAMLADKYEDNSFKTQADVTACGISERIPHVCGMGKRSTHEAIEEFKNAIYKVLMLRARDYLEANPPKGKNPTTVTSIELTLSNGAIHPKENTMDPEALKSESGLFKMLIIPNIKVTDEACDSQDVKDASEFLNYMTLACSK